MMYKEELEDIWACDNHSNNYIVVGVNFSMIKVVLLILEELVP